MTTVRVRLVVSNPVEKSDGTASPFLGLEDLESWTGKLLTEQLPLKQAEDSVRHQGGDVLFSKLRPYLAKSYMPATSGTATGELLVLRPSAEIHPRYLFYLTVSSPWVEWANATAYGTKMPRTSWDLLGEHRIWLPTLEEQGRIVDFLDAETARIDRLVFLRRIQLATSTEAIASRAAQATGRVALQQKSLPPNSMKVPLRRAVRSVQTGSTPTALQEYVPSASRDLRPWYTPAALHGILSVGQAEKAISLDQVGDAPVFPAGSILVTGIGESLGKIGYLDHAATGNQQLTAIQPGNNADGRFLAWQLWVAQDEIREWAQYSRIRIINNDVLKSFPIWLPDLGDQVMRRKELDEHRQDLERLSDKIVQFSEKIKERRQALITAAATGQIDISTASGRGIED